MKQAILFSLAFILSISAFAETLIVRSRAFNVKTGVQAEVSIGFSDSTFNYLSNEISEDELKAIKFCYVGNAYEVCDIVKKDVALNQELYSHGGHDVMDLTSCNAHLDKFNNPVVDVRYTLTDDYGIIGFPVDRTIEACERNP